MPPIMNRRQKHHCHHQNHNHNHQPHHHHHHHHRQQQQHFVAPTKCCRAEYEKQLLYMLIMIIVMFSNAIVLATGQSDWMQNCGVCHCHWTSAKKTADCKSKNLTAIPHNLSNEMQVVDFSQNIIPELRREEFVEANLNNLHKIYLRNCTIQSVNRDAFKGLEILIELDLAQNFIKELHATTFLTLVKLRILVMNNNEIEVIHNKTFAEMPFLSRVEFRQNRLRIVEVNAFGNLPQLSTVYLEANNLTVLSRETFSKTPKLLHLSLAQNPWNCTCELRALRDFSVTERLYTAPTSCHEPAALRGLRWDQVPSEDFACRPRILGSIRTFMEAQSDNITLPCQIEGMPRPNVTWVYNRRQINPNDYRFRVHNTIESSMHYDHDARGDASNRLMSELRIYGVRASDKGAYTCIAENRGGRAEAEIQLLVNGDHFGVMDAMGGAANGAMGTSASDGQMDIFMITTVIITIILFLMIITVSIIFFYCRHIKTYQKKDPTIISENGLIASKIEKTPNASMLEGSVIMEMQKSLLTDVNPVEKPPRRTDLESIDGCDDGLEIKKTLLDESQFGHHSRDDETHSIALSDTATSRTRHTYVDDTYGNSLPPDLLAFPARVPPTSPSMQSSQSNIPEHIIYGIRSPPLTSPVYAHMSPHGIYGTTTIATATPNGFMTLQHPKSRNLALIAAANSRQQHHQQHHQQQQLQLQATQAVLAAAVAQQHHHQQQQQQQQQQHQLHAPQSLSPLQQHHLQQQHQHQQQQHLQQQQQQQQMSPFMPAPVVYAATPNTSAAVVMKQGYMTIPRKPRVPSWAPSSASVAQNPALSEFQSPTSPNPSESGTATTVELQTEPVYDNLGLRTTAGGNSTLNLHKQAQQAAAAAAAAAVAAAAASGTGSATTYTMRDRPLPATPSLSSVHSGSAIIMQSPSQQLQQHTPPQPLGHSTPTTMVAPATSSSSSSAAAAAATTTTASALATTKLYEPLHELNNASMNGLSADSAELLYGTARHQSGVTMVPSAAHYNGHAQQQHHHQQQQQQQLSPASLSSTSSAKVMAAAAAAGSSGGGTVPAATTLTADGTKVAKIPPRPPPKPKKKIAVTASRTGQGSTSQLFDDEGEDGTEV